ncbi:hypothetical protein CHINAEXTREME_18655 [Halobiforma lacisalsi AJ5]|uniref:Uncharacterized protein n=1 Tax=Natronobacterium lacisalsi AJ5 TaxID=358396 RepID=M0LR35_NATLA|nr:hypothetical protein [Halobiforma lacisalsi]APW99666.1 hypothetical protein CHINAEXTREME_18655 [Halobiforma lacisalsi AJ5]EMA35543.1 hypothetical protein C445_04903 [Halobiforma lacisalsi AJ5]
MTDPTREQVTEILDETDAASARLMTAGDEGEDEAPADADEFREAARKANELVASADPDALLEAVGLDTLPDGSEPSSIPEAISEGDADAVEDLERLLRLADLGDRVDEDEVASDLDVAVDGLQAATRGGDGETETGAETAPEEGERADAEPKEHGEPSEDGDGESEDGAADDLEERLRDAVKSNVTEFSDGIDRLRDQLEGMAEGDADSGADSESESGEPDRDEPSDGEDDGLLESDLGAGGRDSPSGATRHSTMAPSPSKRADLRAVRRFSTMPERNQLFDEDEGQDTD